MQLNWAIGLKGRRREREEKKEEKEEEKGENKRNAVEARANVRASRSSFVRLSRSSFTFCDTSSRSVSRLTRLHRLTLCPLFISHASSAFSSEIDQFHQGTLSYMRIEIIGVCS